MPDDPALIEHTRTATRRQLQSSNALAGVPSPPECGRVSMTFTRFMPNCTDDDLSATNTSNCTNDQATTWIRNKVLQFYELFGGPEEEVVFVNATNVTNATNYTVVQNITGGCIPAIALTREYSPPNPPPSPPPTPPPPQMPGATAELCACAPEDMTVLNSALLRGWLQALGPIVLESSCADDNWPATFPACSLSIISEALRAGRVMTHEIMHGTAQQACTNAISRLCKCPLEINPLTNETICPTCANHSGPDVNLFLGLDNTAHLDFSEQVVRMSVVGDQTYVDEAYRGVSTTSLPCRSSTRQFRQRATILRSV